MIWFLLYILLTIGSFYILAYCQKTKYQLKEVTLADVQDEYGPLLLFTIIPVIHFILALAFGIMTLLNIFKDAKIL